MDDASFSEDSLPQNSFLPILEKHRLSLGLTLMSLLLLSGLAMSQILSRPKPESIKIIPVKSQDQKTDLTEKILVDVSGAVAIPGVYQLPAASRTELAIRVAGGLTEEADQDFVAENINLAAKLTDGAKVYIPKIGEKISNISTQTMELISINTASSSELDTLPGIGPKTAEKIINGRPYQAVEELLTRKIVGKSVFEKIKDMVEI